MSLKTITHAKPLLPVLTCFFLFMSCKEVKPQTPQEREDAEKILNRENVEQFYLGAIKMCKDTDYKSYFGQYREMTSYLKEGTCCTALVPKPYIDPYEYFIEIFKREKPIMANNANPFELKKIREILKGEKAGIKKKAMAIDVNNLENKTTGSFVKYDVNTEELKINCSTQLAFAGGPFSGRITRVDLVNFSGELSIPLNPDSAEKLFEYYKENHPIGKLIPFTPLNVRITYGLQFPERNIKYSKFEGIVKTMEIYPANNWSYKVATVTF